MTDQEDESSTYSPLPSNRDNSNAEDTPASCIPMSDFRRNEARVILIDNDRHKSSYHQPSFTKYTSTERYRKHHRRSQSPQELANNSAKTASSNETKNSCEIDNPSARIKFLLGDDDQDEDDNDHKPHALFIELNELKIDDEKTNESGESNDLGWTETARWIKFEEDVETGGRWSKPHVATLSLHSLLELRNCVLNGCIILDTKADQLSTIIDIVLDAMIANESLPSEKRSLTRNALLLKHIHQHDKEFHRLLNTKDSKKPLPFTHSFAEITRNRSQKDVQLVTVDQVSLRTSSETMNHHLTLNNRLGVSNQSKSRLGEYNELGNILPSTESHVKMNLSFMKKVPPNSEATNVLIGAVEFLQNPVCAFIRLVKGVTMPDLLEVPLPIRFLFILIGPSSEHLRYHEIGRSMSTIMSDEIFHDVVYRARDRQDLLAGIDDFLDHVTVLPPGEWDPTTRIEPPKSVPNKEDRLDRNKLNGISQSSEPTRHEHELDPSLLRTGRFCGGLINDIKRKAPFYMSDFTDAFSIQSIAAMIFLYFACLSPIITFGGLLSKATDNHMAAIESLLSGAVCGCLFHLFAGQPLAILGSTGPVLVFETIIHSYCSHHGIDYMNFRCWIGLWTTFILLVMVVTDASYLVKYITRFTEESFAALIGIIFIYEALDKIIDINHHRPIRLHTNQILPQNCSCIIMNIKNISNSAITINDCYKKQSYEFFGTSCANINDKIYIPDVFFFSIILFLSTFILAYTLKSFKFSRFLSMNVRTKVSDFGVVLAISINVLMDYLVGLDTPKLIVPKQFAPTKENRRWIINPFNKNSPHIWFAAIIPALLVTILIFMDQHITVVIVNRKENKLKKGCGYHLDLLIVAVCIGINSVFGLPWFVAATVLSINHVIALKLESGTVVPGEKPTFSGVREQRVTGSVVFLFIGLSVFLTKFLAFIPMPVLYGVFFYMGISSMKEIQLISRVLLIFMPEKYQPDYVYLQYVRTSRVHLFTLIQISCLVLLWVIKSIKSISILFPIMVLALVGARKLMDYIFTQHELEYLDDVMPDVVRQEIEERRNSGNLDKNNDTNKTNETMGYNIGNNPSSSNNSKTSQALRVNATVRSSNVMNFSEEVGKTSVWKSIAKQKNKEVTISDKKPSRSASIKNRIRKLSLGFRSGDDDRSLANSLNQHPPVIVIESPDDEEQNRGETLAKNNSSMAM